MMQQVSLLRPIYGLIILSALHVRGLVLSFGLGKGFHSHWVVLMVNIFDMNYRISTIKFSEKYLHSLINTTQSH